MATPIYKGVAQPAANAGWLGGLGSWFGVGTPAYGGNGQPGSGSTGYFAGTTPAYASVPPPAASTAQAPSAAPTETITLVVPRGLIAPECIDPQQ